MPQYRLSALITGRQVGAARVLCDGCDPARPCEEHATRNVIWLLTAGAFELRDSDGVHAIDPTHALVLPLGHAFTIRHPAGPDICVSFRGPLIDRLAGDRARLIALSAARAARLAGELTAWRRGEGDDLAVAELLATLDAGEPPPPSPPTRRDRTLAGAVAHALRLTFADEVSLGELADTAGYSVFHTCRVFRAATGHTIAGFRRELRLRHALVRIVEGDEPLAAIAAHAGFASQSHLTNLFRARFGVTPARARTRAGARRLAELAGSAEPRHLTPSRARAGPHPRSPEATRRSGSS